VLHAIEYLSFVEPIVLFAIEPLLNHGLMFSHMFEVYMSRHEKVYSIHQLEIS